MAAGAVAPGVDGPVAPAFRIARTPILRNLVHYLMEERAERSAADVLAFAGAG
jgi:hypothetical protein